jgi:hypothetical protein
MQRKRTRRFVRARAVIGTRRRIAQLAAPAASDDYAEHQSVGDSLHVPEHVSVEFACSDPIIACLVTAARALNVGL